MALENVVELASVLHRPERLGKVFARHAYGMRAWVDLFSARIPAIADPELKALVATIVSDNARHMLMFRAAAAAHGIDPDAYVCPPEGEAIYARLDELRSEDDVLAYALGSLDHFDALLAVYREAAHPADVATIDAVRADNDRAREAVRARVAPAATALSNEAHELYRLRELAETPLYAHGD